MGASHDKRNIFSTFLLIALTSAGYAQTQSDSSFLKLLFIPENHAGDHTAVLNNSNTELKVIASSLFLFYKEFISSQDVDACVFTPSCSNYTFRAINEKGITGVLDGLDRLMRCHPLASKKDYPYDPKTKKLYDPL